ncbi:MAG: amino acid ABC transporter permease [Gordonia sp.]|jgi:glutamate transport system permease protein|uniref:amino acid ABC transporter permease n=1 Tax=Gordonia sp. (in: high G+C Gram-positive bacteria) TaxID=84139 RepID=UPI001E146EA7|nr:amino acid ABC transporter permease [Gordonia sp. (in: high G+C Gram-positive bacteria)]MCB1294583.1 amino acid ABC transporter permease [Gordonia sp. (in: high G+C Gram-positive bacteria)]HMS76197.1 amino acid ABC transporter permease [Gordonia sp. (in: high G+C Gram-positive bacteria)]HQV17496.1 amino acid ABC transporter permease [Gordonia sp. (in: high G+C Gram-positive bacteria)]
MSDNKPAGATVLYDAPGPKAQARNRIITVAFLAVIATIAIWVIVTLAGNDQFAGEKWEPFTYWSTWKGYILPGLWRTVAAAIVSIILALILGSVLGIGRLSDHTWVRAVSGTLIEVFRAIPVLILMVFCWFLLAKYGVVPSSQLAFTAVVIGLTLYNGSVIAEIIRSGINSLPNGQTEASKALGLRKGQMMRIILLPQAVTAMLPALVSQMVIALKDSALGYIIGYSEVIRSGLLSSARYGNYIPALIVIAIIMILINFGLSSLATYLEKRLRTGRRKVAAVDPDEVDIAASENLPTFGTK